MLRRHFLTLPAAVLLSLRAGLTLGADGANVDPHKIVFIADTHVGPDVPNHAANLKRIVDEILAMDPRPAMIFILGDLVSTYGKSEEYLEMKGLMQPITDAGIPWHLVVGNHDTRERMFEVFPEKRMTVEGIPGKQVGVVEADGVDFIILDSRMDDTRAYMAEKDKFPNRRPWDGTMEAESVAWLEKTLPAREKPCFVLAHHPLEQTNIGPLLGKYPCVQGYLFGHNHQYRRYDFTCEPGPVRAFAFPTTSNRQLTPKEPNGFMVMEIQPTQFEFTLHALDASHPQAGDENVMNERR